MEEKPQDSLDNDDSANSLEPPEDPSKPDSPDPINTTKDANNTEPLPVEPSDDRSFFKKVKSVFNIYLILFIVVCIVASAVAFATYLTSKRSTTTTNFGSKTLSAATLAQLANSNATVGTSGQILNVQSNAVFAGKVLVRQDLDVAGNLNLGGSLGLNNLLVNGTTQLGQAQINKNLSVAGNTSLQGPTTIAKSLQVSGTGSFSGALSAPQVTTSNLQLNGDLILTHHISAGGATPAHSGGPALGGGGTSTLSGSDTSGSITVNTGNAPGAGCFITINFSVKYNSVPHVIVTPIGSAAGAINYYIDRSTSSFSICDSTPPPSGSSFGFDYFVVD